MTLETRINSDDPAVVSLCERYWDFQDGKFLETVKQIQASNPFDAQVYKIVSEHCVAYSTELDCSACNKPFVFKNRGEFTRLFGKTDHVNWVCSKCELENKKAIADEQREVLLSAFEHAKEYPLKIEELDVRQAVLLRALILYSATEDLSHINPFDRGQIVPFSPLLDFSIELLREMYQSSLISIHPNTDLRLLDFSEGLSFRFDLTDVPWALALEHGCSLEEFSGQLAEKISSLEYLESDPDGVRNLCHEVSLKECIAYLEGVTDEYDFNFRVGPKTLEAINKALKYFSVAQVYNFIWRAGKDAAAYFQRSMVPKAQAANSIVGSIDRAVDQALANDWDVKPYRRRYNEPQSVLSKVVFNHLLHTDDGGFNKSLDKLL